MVQAAELDDTAKGRVLQQVEFYFSDSNAPRDKFLFSKIQDDPEGYVDLALICSFSRMQRLLFKNTDERITDVPADVVTKVADILSSSSQLELSSSRTRLRRTTPLDPETAMAEVDARSIYAKPFPFDVTLDGLMQFWGKVAATRGVRLRRHVVSLDFKGSVFVEFDTPATAEQVLGKTLEHEGAALVMEPKVHFLEKKAKERKEKAAAGGGSAAAPAPGSSTSKPDALGDAAAGASGANGTAEPSTSSSFIPGSVLRLHFAGEGALPDYSAVKEALGGREAGVRFVETSDEGSEAFVRFESADKAAAGHQKANVGSVLTVGAREATVSVLEGDAEQQFAARQAQKFQKVQAEGGRGRKRPHDGQGPSRGRGRGRRGRGRS